MTAIEMAGSDVGAHVVRLPFALDIGVRVGQVSPNVLHYAFRGVVAP